MLVLARKVGEEIIIDGKIRVKVVGVSGSRVRIAIDAPRTINIRRVELEEHELAELPSAMTQSRRSTELLPA